MFINRQNFVEKTVVESIDECIASMTGAFTLNTLLEVCEKKGITDRDLVAKRLNEKINNETVLYHFVGINKNNYLTDEMMNLLEAYKLFYKMEYKTHDANHKKLMISMCYLMGLKSLKLGKYSFSCGIDGVVSTEIDEILQQIDKRGCAVRNFYSSNAYYPPIDCVLAYTLGESLDVENHNKDINRWMSVLSSFAIWYNALGYTKEKNNAFDLTYDNMCVQNYINGALYDFDYTKNAYNFLMKAQCIK